MSIELMCRKVGMSRVFADDGECIPVTVVEVGPNVVVQKKASNPEGYWAVQLGYGERRPDLFNKPTKGHFAKAGMDPKRHLVESRLSEEEATGYEVGQELNHSFFNAGEVVDVIGTSKGRGFSGVVRRHNFAIKKRTHGTHEAFRHGGSIGAGAWPSKVIKGMGMAGQHGNARTTVRNLEIVRIDEEKSLLFLRGAVPGHRNGIVRVRKAVTASS